MNYNNLNLKVNVFTSNGLFMFKILLYYVL